MLNIQRLVYGDRNLVLSSVNTLNNNIINPVDVAKFLITLNQMNYSIKNIDPLFSLSTEGFSKFKDELFSIFDSMKIDGFIFRKTFADTQNLTNYTNDEWLTIFAQYSLTYDWSSQYTYIFDKNPYDMVNDYFSDIEGISEDLFTNLKEFSVSFDLKNDLKNILIDILSSKTVLREQQVKIIEESPYDILVAAYQNSDISIKENEIHVFKRILNQNNIDINYFSDIDQIVRIVANLYSTSSKEYDLTNEQLNNQMLKNFKIKMPTKVKKVITKSLNRQKDTDYVVEKMFKYFGFWKKIIAAVKWEGDNKTSAKYPTFMEIKNKLYINDRSNTLNSKVEVAKFNGDYDTAVRTLATNPGLLMRNLLEYLRYSKGTTVAKKIKPIQYKNPNRYNIYTDEELFNNKVCIGDIITGKSTKNMNKLRNNPERTIIVKTDAFDFFNSTEFVNTLMKTNSKLLWKTLSLLDNELLFESRTNRLVQKTNISYQRPLPGLNRNMVNSVKKAINKAIKKIKKIENKELGKVFISDDIKNYSVEFSGRESSGLSLSGEYLSPGSKIPFDKLIGKDKILRLGIAWRGKTSCDIDHSLNLLDKNQSVYYGEPVFPRNRKFKNIDEVIITSSGDITSCSNDIFSTELIDIDLDKAQETNIGDMITSAIQYSGQSFDEYEILWFMNIIDKKDRIINSRKISIKLDQMDYAIQINKKSKSMLGFYINMQEQHLEVLNISLDDKHASNGMNSVNSHKKFEEVLKHRDPLIPMDEALFNVIKKSQIIDNIEEADIIISSSVPKKLTDEQTCITPGTQLEKINDIIF